MAAILNILLLVGDSTLIFGRKIAQQNQRALNGVYSAPTAAKVTDKTGFNDFQRDRTSVFNEPGPGAPKTATMEDNMIKLHDLAGNRRLKMRG